ncbi:high-affinity iron transporter [Pseudochelatococcus lubricantis]|uniref:High-affinity iron transporter n=1 Tax=Pseudochelatococcus lubricantis TaxID=1538102 RepID=A0ABX0V1J7_9HYPH|nr:FTR1 family protein [Pseudochelatococcus lubricantis]NIJ59017.1 high-affinity iron transporter [Pseudochelatococcus lubricantis]
MRMFLAILLLSAQIFILDPFVGSASPHAQTQNTEARSGLDYALLVSRIDALLAQGLDDYRAGRVDAAKTAVQRSYFEIFENLEGPIRVNISARRSYQLESEFGAIRRLMTEGATIEEVEARIRTHIAALDAIVPQLEKGHRIVAERGGDAPAVQPEAVAEEGADIGPKTVEPYWERAVETIHRRLLEAADALERGNPEEARALIRKGQFDGYKNSLLETAIRRYVSQQRDGEFNAEFNRIVGLVNDNREPRLVRGSARVLRDDLTALLLGLPLVGTAKEQAEASTSSADWNAVARKIRDQAAHALSLAAGGDAAGAVGILQDTYFDVFEASGMEARVGARDSAFKTRIEAHFSRLMALIRDGAPAPALHEVADNLNTDVAQAAELLGGAGAGSWSALFLASLLIIVREGFEAILIVSAIVAYLVKTGHGDKRGVIVNSVVVAVIASVITAILLKLVFRTSAASQEVLEGATMLLAAVVLFFTSNWLLAKAEAAQWSAFIRGKVEGAISAGSLRALWFVSFLAVYREGAETVLFYQALTIDTDAAGVIAIAAGFAVGALALVAVYWAMQKGALRLPVGPFFRVTGAILYLMAFVFVGKGIFELIEGKVITPTLVGRAPEIPLLGIYPYRETLLPQAVFVAVTALSLVIIWRRGKRQAAALPKAS